MIQTLTAMPNYSVTKNVNLSQQNFHAMKYIKYVVIFTLFFGFQMLAELLFYAKNEFSYADYTLYALCSLGTVGVIYLVEFLQSRKLKQIQ